MSGIPASAMLKAMLKGRRISYPHPWEKYDNLILENGGIVDANAWGFKVHLDDGIYDVEIPGGLTKQHYDRFAPLVDDWGKTLLAKGVLQNLLRPKYLDWWEAWWLLQEKHGPDEEEWLPQLVEAVGFEAVAKDMEQAVVAYSMSKPMPAFSVFEYDSTGQWHSADYRVCRDREGRVYNVSALVAKLIQVLNMALKQRIPEMNKDTLLLAAMNHSASTPELADEIRIIRNEPAYRLDHLFARYGVWQTLVFPAERRGCYQVRP